MKPINPDFLKMMFDMVFNIIQTDYGYKCCQYTSTLSYNDGVFTFQIMFDLGDVGKTGLCYQEYPKDQLDFLNCIVKKLEYATNISYQRMQGNPKTLDVFTLTAVAQNFNLYD